MLSRLARPLVFGVGLFCGGALWAEDWPQFRGGRHNGISDERILTRWAGSVTNPVWRTSLTNCLGSLVISGNRLFTQTVRPVAGVRREICVALDARTGAERWAVAVDDANYPDGGVGFDDGPRTTPAIAGDSVYVLTSYLKLWRLNVTNGAVIWSKDLRSLYGGTVIAWQNAASPLIEEDFIFLNANSPTGSLLALRTSDGSLAWRSQNFGLTHASPVMTAIHGVRQLIFATQQGLVSMDPQTGARLWTWAYSFSFSTSLGASPVVDGDLVFVCGAHAYGMGAMGLQVTLTNSTWVPRRLWATNNPSSHWMTPVAHEGFLYGQFGIQSFDSARAQLKCVDMRTGEVKWSTNDFGRGGTILVDGRLLTLTERGQLVLSEPNPNAYTEIARFLAIPGYDQFTNKCWNVPAVADGYVYARGSATVAAFNFSIPKLKLEVPEFTAPDRLAIRLRAQDGSNLTAERAAAFELLQAGDWSGSTWNRVTNGLVFTNGAAQWGNLRVTGSNQFFQVSEPK